MNYRTVHAFLLPVLLLGLRCPQPLLAHSQEPVATLADSILRKPACYQDVCAQNNSVLSPIEWEELQVEDLVQGIAEYTHTSLGIEGARWLLVPLNDRAQIENRQLILRTLVEREDILNQFETALIAIKRGESQLLVPNNTTLNRQIGIEKVDTKLNRSPLYLDILVWNTLVISTIVMSGMAYFQFFNTKKNYSPYKTISDDQYINLMASTTGPEADITIKQSQEVKLMQYAYLEHVGSAGDKAIFKQYINETLYAPKAIRERIANLAYRIPESDYKKMSYINVYCKQIISDYIVYWPLLWLSSSLKEVWGSLAEQQARYVNIASATRALKTLCTGINGVFADTQCVLTEHTQQVLDRDNWDKDIKDFVVLLESATFSDTSSWLFRRGNVMKACNLHSAVGTKLSPFLQTIAEWDAYCALAKMYKKVQNRDARYCFVEFVDSATPYVRIDDAWTPLARANDPVTNHVRMGTDNRTIRMFLTGPNGCGKSTYMKAFTHAIILAQSCGLAPASHAQLAFFDGIRTSLHPQEDVLNGISTFMAQKLRIDAVSSFASSSNHQYKVLALFDEPFSGTTDAQIELRVHQLGQQMMHLPYTASCIATHVEKPTELSATGLFDNYQVEVEELAHGGFRRTFKIQPGVAHWWFADHEKVTRFVDWIGGYQKPAVAQPTH